MKYEKAPVVGIKATTLHCASARVLYSVQSAHTSSVHDTKVSGVALASEPSHDHQNGRKKGKKRERKEKRWKRPGTYTQMYATLL